MGKLRYNPSSERGRRGIVVTTFRTGGDYWIFATGPVAWTVTLASSRRSQDRLP